MRYSQHKCATVLPNLNNFEALHVDCRIQVSPTLSCGKISFRQLKSVGFSALWLLKIKLNGSENDGNLDRFEPLDNEGKERLYVRPFIMCGKFEYFQKIQKILLRYDIDINVIDNIKRKLYQISILWSVEN